MRGGVFEMKWFRSNIRHGARLALFAMLVQIALTFGHSHWFAQAAPLAQSQLADSAKGTAKSIASPDSAAMRVPARGECHGDCQEHGPAR